MVDLGDTVLLVDAPSGSTLGGTLERSPYASKEALELVARALAPRATGEGLATPTP